MYDREVDSLVDDLCVLAYGSSSLVLIDLFHSCLEYGIGDDWLKERFGSAQSMVGWFMEVSYLVDLCNHE